MEPENSWIDLLAHIQKKVPRITYRTWFEPITFQSDDGHTLRLGIPSEIFGSWFELRYAAVVQQALAETGRAGTRVHYIPPAAGSGLRSCFLQDCPTTDKLVRH